jgi:hypothetical protein
VVVIDGWRWAGLLKIVVGERASRRADTPWKRMFAYSGFAVQGVK